MSEFWLGAFAALTVWKFIGLLSGFAMYGKEYEIDLQKILIEAAFVTVFAFAAWYVAVF